MAGRVTLVDLPREVLTQILCMVGNNHLSECRYNTVAWKLSLKGLCSPLYAALTDSASWTQLRVLEFTGVPSPKLGFMVNGLW